MADVEFEFGGNEEGNNCHICYREMDNHTPHRGEKREDGYVTHEKGIGICPEHGTSYDAISVKPPERGTCSCGKEDCPVCGS